MDNKTDLRIWAKSIRKTLNLADISKKITAKIRDNDIYKKAENVMLFYPTKYEISLLDLLNDKKNFYLPKVCNDEILVCPYSKDDSLEVSQFNIKEPCTNPVKAEHLELAIVPALVVDKKGYRLGYGGGFYDRFLSKFPIKTIVPIPHELIVEKLPIEKFDIKIDVVITDI